MANNLISIKISENKIQSRISELAKIINKDFKNSDTPIIIGILKGSIFFISDLVRKLDFDLKLAECRSKFFNFPFHHLNLPNYLLRLMPPYLSSNCSSCFQNCHDSEHLSFSFASLT